MGGERAVTSCSSLRRQGWVLVLHEVFLDKVCIHQVDIAAHREVEVPYVQFIHKVETNNLCMISKTGTGVFLVALSASRQLRNWTVQRRVVEMTKTELVNNPGTIAG